eukprot:COSAG06_NODE_2174_length_7412_cov_4.617394_7_plen_148_part_00
MTWLGGRSCTGTGCKRLLSGCWTTAPPPQKRKQRLVTAAGWVVAGTFFCSVTLRAESSPPSDSAWTGHACAALCCTALHCAASVLCCTALLLCCAALLLCCAVLCCAASVLCCAVLRCAASVLCCAVLCCAALCVSTQQMLEIFDVI